MSDSFLALSAILENKSLKKDLSQMLLIFFFQLSSWIYFKDPTQGKLSPHKEGLDITEEARHYIS